MTQNTLRKDQFIKDRSLFNSQLENHQESRHYQGPFGVSNTQGCFLFLFLCAVPLPLLLLNITQYLIYWNALLVFLPMSSAYSYYYILCFLIALVCYDLSHPSLSLYHVGFNFFCSEFPVSIFGKGNMMSLVWLFYAIPSLGVDCRWADDLAVFESVANCFQSSMALGWR